MRVTEPPIADGGDMENSRRNVGSIEERSDSKEMVPQSQNHKKLDSANQNELRSRFLPEPLGKSPEVNTLVWAL